MRPPGRSRRHLFGVCCSDVARRGSARGASSGAVQREILEEGRRDLPK